MKYGYIDFDLTVNWYWDNSWNNKALLNVGDAAEYKVVQQLYGKLGIPEEKMQPICINDLTEYRGEKLIVALNIALDSYVGYNRILEELSPDIIPVFLGMSFTDTKLNEKQIECLKMYAPIGCRDERSYELMRSFGIECYLNGCTASCLELDKGVFHQSSDRILFIDVPAAVAKYVPKRLKKDIRFLSQEIYCRRSDLPVGFIPSKWADNIMEEYSSGARLIVTSRFHGAVLALAENIPAIVTLEKMTFRFSWIEKHLPIYVEGNYEKINWDIAGIDYSRVKKLIEKISLQRIRTVSEKYSDILEITDIQRSCPVKKRESTNQTLYYEKAWETICQKWKKDKPIHYAFWGINDNSENLYKLISENYPNAELIEIYDMFRQVKMNDIVSVHPSEIKKHIDDEDFYLIITAYLAVRVAGDICEGANFPDDRIIKCERPFVTQQDL